MQTPEQKEHRLARRTLEEMPEQKEHRLARCTLLRRDARAKEAQAGKTHITEKRRQSKRSTGTRAQSAEAGKMQKTLHCVLAANTGA